tara:strand:+ start:205 stop:618 length:414 start_codon:yes stop_codon:yes gene_type:complete
MSKAGHIESLSKKFTKKLGKELFEDLATIFPQPLDGEDKADPRLLAAWLRIQRVIHSTLNPGSALESFEVENSSGERIVITFKSSHDWYNSCNEVQCTTTFYDSDGDKYTELSETLTKEQILRLFNFTSTALAHHDR